jgi:hypothetical protein
MRLIPCLLAGIVLAAGCGGAARPPHGADSREALMAGIRQAAEAKDLQTYLSLTCWERLPPHLRKRFEASTPLFMKRSVESVRLSEDREDRIAGLSGFKWNVAFRGYIEVRYDGMEEPARLPYGEFDGRFYLATAIKADREF